MQAGQSQKDSKKAVHWSGIESGFTALKGNAFDPPVRKGEPHHWPPLRRFCGITINITRDDRSQCHIHAAK